MFSDHFVTFAVLTVTNLIKSHLFLLCGRTINYPSWQDMMQEPITNSLGLPSTSIHTQSQEGET